MRKSMSLASSSDLRQTQEYFRRLPYATRIALASVDGRRGGGALQPPNRFEGRAGGIFEGERDVPIDFDVLTEKAEVGHALGNDRRPVAALALQPDVVDVGHVAGNADRRAYDCFRLRGPFLHLEVMQNFPQDLPASAFIHGLPAERAIVLRMKPIAPPNIGAWRLIEDFRLL